LALTPLILLPDFGLLLLQQLQLLQVELLQWDRPLRVGAVLLRLNTHMQRSDQGHLLS
jgi:hypothetical protein